VHLDASDPATKPRCKSAVGCITSAGSEITKKKEEKPDRPERFETKRLEEGRGWGKKAGKGLGGDNERGEVAREKRRSVVRRDEIK